MGTASTTSVSSTVSVSTTVSSTVLSSVSILVSSTIVSAGVSVTSSEEPQPIKPTIIVVAINIAKNFFFIMYNPSFICKNLIT